MAITPNNVQNAFEYIRQNGFAPNRESTKWDIIDPETQQRFPPKAVLRVAYDLAGQEQPNVGGGWPTNDPLKELGFQIVLKPNLEESDEAADIRNIFQSESDETTRRRLVSARLGQGAFREALLEIWESKCAITECRIKNVLRASHIKPWRASNNFERLDPRNGILLAASLDALFDSCLVSFSDCGEMLVASSINRDALTQLGIPAGKTISFHEATRQYLESHRDDFNTNANGPFRW
jgi:predicted restriction endonuclease